MKVIFVLVFIFTDSRAGGVKIGEYERRAQCVEQGEMIKASRVRQLWGGDYLCVPANATTNR